MCLLPSLKWSSIVSSLGIVQWDFTRRDHPGNLGRVSGSGPVTGATHSFISREYVARVGMTPVPLGCGLEIATPT